MKIYTTDSIYKLINILSKNDGFKKDFTWHYLFIISHIRTYGLINSQYKDSEYVPLSIKRLRQCVSYDNANKLLKILEVNKIIESDGKYTPREKSRGYKLTENLKNGDSWKLLEVEDKMLNKKLEDLLGKSKQILINSEDGYGKVTRFVERLKLDVQKSLNFIDVMDAPEERKIQYRIVCKMFDSKFAVKDSSGRLHNNLTNMPSFLRQFVKYEEEDIYQIDIKCSQPTFFGLYLLKNKLGDSEEIYRYLQDCKNGEFYEKVLKKDKFKNRKDLKKAVFAGCFFNKTRKNLNSAEKSFKNAFPSVFDELQKIKKVDYKRAAIYLQNEESQFIYDFVKSCKTPCCTIHDSILSTNKNIDFLKKELELNFKNVYNFLPELSVEKA